MPNAADPSDPANMTQQQRITENAAVGGSGRSMQWKNHRRAGRYGPAAAALGDCRPFQEGGRTISTEQCARAATEAATLPISRRSTRGCPTAPRKMASTSSRSASAAMSRRG